MAVYKRDHKTGRHVADSQPGYFVIKFERGSRKPFYKSLRGISTRKKAELLEEKFLMKYLSGEREEDKTRLDDFIRKTYLPNVKMRFPTTYDQFSHYCEIIMAFFRAKTLREITPEDIAAFQLKRKNETTNRGTPRNAVTVNREMAQLSSIFTYAVKMRRLDKNPCRSVDRLEAPKVRRPAATPEQEAALLAELKGVYERFRPFVIIAADTGIRRGEMLKLRWEFIDLKESWSLENEAQASWLNLPGAITKNKKPRRIPMTQRVHETMKALQASRKKDGLVFPEFTVQSVSQGIATASRKAGLKKVGLHSFRHKTQTQMHRLGVPLVSSQTVMGHSDVDMTVHYTEVDTQDVLAAMRKLQEGA